MKRFVLLVTIFSFLVSFSYAATIKIEMDLLDSSECFEPNEDSGWVKDGDEGHLDNLLDGWSKKKDKGTIDGLTIDGS